MKLLYAIQGTGNGHLARAEDIIPILAQYGTLDVFVSGAQADIKLSYPVKYKSKGLSFYFGTKGGIDFLKTFKHNSSKDVYREIKKFPVEKYDLVINDFEPITAWACRKREVPCIGLSHQSALLSPLVPKPKKIDPVGEWVLRNYAPIEKYVSFHFERYDGNIFTPVIRKSIREEKRIHGDHYTVYLPAYDDRKLVPLLSRIPDVRWQVFSKHTKSAYHVGGLSVYPVSKQEFSASVSSAKGILCGAGFETPAEALYLEKKLMVIPMQSQLEQYYNAASLKRMGVPVLKKLNKKSLQKIMEWIDTDARVSVTYHDIAAEAVELAMEKSRNSK
jgi:uncharacterized protein (TIGR00661 family)